MQPQPVPSYVFIDFHFSRCIFFGGVSFRKITTNPIDSNQQGKKKNEKKKLEIQNWKLFMYLTKRPKLLLVSSLWNGRNSSCLLFYSQSTRTGSQSRPVRLLFLPRIVGFFAPPNHSILSPAKVKDCSIAYWIINLLVDHKPTTFSIISKEKREEDLE